MKILTRLVALLAALLVAAVVAFFVYVDVIAGRAIERGGSQALGVETKVGFVRLSLLRGVLHVGGLRVRNPPGNFDETHLLVFDDTRLEIDLGSLREDVVVAPSLQIEGVEVDLEKDGKQTNFGKVLANLDRFEDADDGGAGDASAGPGRRFIVKELVIRDLVAHYEHTDHIGKLGKIDVLVPEVRLENVGAEDAQGVPMEELTAIVVKSVFLAIARNGAALPNWLQADMLGNLRSLSSLPIEIVGGTAGALVDTLPEPAGDAVRELGAVAGEAVDGLKGLFRSGEKRD